MAMAAGFERIFETGPVFRAEKFATRKHSTEFTSFDLEFSYIDSFHDVMHMEEEMLEYALKAVKEKYGDEIKKVFNKCVEYKKQGKNINPLLLELKRYKSNSLL